MPFIIAPVVDRSNIPSIRIGAPAYNARSIGRGSGASIGPYKALSDRIYDGFLIASSQK